MINLLKESINENIISRSELLVGISGWWNYYLWSKDSRWTKFRLRFIWASCSVPEIIFRQKCYKIIFLNIDHWCSWRQSYYAIFLKPYFIHSDGLLFVTDLVVRNASTHWIVVFWSSFPHLPSLSVSYWTLSVIVSKNLLGW